jgi:tetratricopeptide (TPR) repeat protein
VKLGAGTAVVQQDLAEALLRLNRLDESVEHLRTAIDMEPYDPVLHKTLALRLIAQKKYPQALEEMRRYVDLFPEDDFMRGLLAKASAASTSAREPPR